MTQAKLDSALGSLVDRSAAIAVVGLLSVQEVDRMRIAQARVLRWIKGADRSPLVSYVAEGSWVADLSGRDPGETALVFLESLSASDLDERGPLRNRPHLRVVPAALASQRLWQLSGDGMGWMPCRYMHGRYHAVVWRTELSIARTLTHAPAPRPWRDLADAVPLNELLDAICVRIGQR